MSRKLITPTKAGILGTQPPVSTRTYKTVSHGQIIDTLSEELDKQGFIIINENYSASVNNQIINGHLQLGGLNIDSELSFEIAFINSYNKTKRAVVVAGSQVRICENGHILGDTSLGLFQKKHVGTVSDEIMKFIPDMVKAANESFSLLKKQKDRMKEIEIDRKVRNELIGQFYLDDALITDTQMSIIKREIENPSFAYNADTNSLWQLYNNVTLAMKETHPSKWIGNHQKLNKVVNDQFQLV